MNRGRGRGRVAWRISGSVLALLALVGFTVQVVGVLAHGESTVVRTFAASDVDTVAVSTDRGSVRIVGAETDRIRARVTVADGLVATTQGARVVGRRLVLDAECPWLAQWWCRADYTVRVPRSVAVVVRNGDGPVRVVGVDGGVDTAG
jgi:hypothetical protein